MLEKLATIRKMLGIRGVDVAVRMINEIEQNKKEELKKQLIDIVNVL